MDDFRKDDARKCRPELIPADALIEVAGVFGHGAKKYAPGNWQRCDKRSRYLGAAQRHLLAWQAGEDEDPESQFPHLAHAAANVLMLLGLVLRGLGEDDRDLRVEQLEKGVRE